MAFSRSSEIALTVFVGFFSPSKKIPK